MFSRLKKSFLGSQDTLTTRQYENRTFHNVKDLLCDFEVKSNLSTCQSEILESQKMKKKARKTRLRNIFTSDAEETSSVVSDNPWPYTNRSMSLQILNDRDGKQTNFKKIGRFNELEKSMENIHKSLSISALPQSFVNVGNEKEEKKRENEIPKKIKKPIEKGKNVILKPTKAISSVTYPDEPRQILSNIQNQNKVPKNSNKSVIDLEISSAELEYELEKYKIEIMNAKQSMKALKLNKENQIEELKEETLYQQISASALTVLISEELSQDQLNSVDIRSEGFGLEWQDDRYVGHLKVHDRVFELNGINVFRINNKGWQDLHNKIKFPLQALFIRMKTTGQENQGMARGRKTMTDLRSDITQIQNKLEKKLMEGKNTCNVLKLVEKERDSLGKENMRLFHRIAFLEDHTKELQMGLKQIQNSLEMTLNKEVCGTLAHLGMLGLPPRYGLAGMSDERCSTATSGIYSATDSEISNSPEQLAKQNTFHKVQYSRERSLGLPDAGNHINQNYHKKVNPDKRNVSRIPPPKPARYHLQQSSTNTSYSQANSDSEYSTKNRHSSSRIPLSNKKSASYLHLNRKESHILV